MGIAKVFPPFVPCHMSPSCRVSVLSRFTRKRVFRFIDFDVAQNSLATTAADFVGVRWTGYLEVDHTERHEFYVRANDAARLIVNNQVLMDNWAASAAGGSEGASELKGAADLVKGSFVPITLEFKELAGNASISLSYSSFTLPKQVIPEDKLYRANFIHVGGLKCGLKWGPQFRGIMAVSLGWEQGVRFGVAMVV